MTHGFVFLTVVAALVCALLGLAMVSPTGFLIDDFARDGVSAIGTRWQTFTDRVMGGVSDGQALYETLDGRRCLRLRGRVSLENQGGFVQAALPLTLDGGLFDGSAFQGIRLWVRGNENRYYIHLRTADSRRPWQYYAAGFDAGAAWEMVEIPFSAFAPENMQTPLNRQALMRLAVVAAKQAFSADVAVARIEFYE